MNELIVLTTLLVFITMSYIIKFVLKEYGYEISLFTNHHKDLSLFLKIITSSVLTKKKFIYLIILIIYLISFGIFIIKIIEELV